MKHEAIRLSEEATSIASDAKWRIECMATSKGSTQDEPYRCGGRPIHSLLGPGGKKSSRVMIECEYKQEKNNHNHAVKMKEICKPRRI